MTEKEMQEIMEMIESVPLAYLRMKREALGLTQKNFAKLFDMDEDVYRKYESGERRPKANVYQMMKLIIRQYEDKHSCTQGI